MVSVGQMAKRWLIFSSYAILDAPQKHPCVIFIHPHMIMIALIIMDWPGHCTTRLKERLVPTVAACSHLIRMLRQISTEIQMFNESSSTWQ